MAACDIEPAVVLDDWLRNDFFDEHCKLFHHRPFVWYIWDGRKRDGFHALVNYYMRLDLSPPTISISPAGQDSEVALILVFSGPT